MGQLEAELSSEAGEIVGFIKLNVTEPGKTIVSNYRAQSNASWGKDIIAHRGVVVSADEFREQGNKFFRACKYVEAMKAYNSALDVDPKDAKSYSNRAAAKIELVNQSCTGLPPEKTKTNAYYESAMDDLRE